jgi:hypothetical protein
VRVVVVVCLLLALPACTGNGGEVDAPSGPTGETGIVDGTGATGPTAATGAAGPTGPVPDACSLISSDEIEAITRTHPGTGSTSGSEERSICIYENGLITAVESAANYEVSKAIIEDEREIEPVSDVGVEAFWDPAGQLVARGERYFVGVTIGRTNRTAQEHAAQIAAVMLQGL